MGDTLVGKVALVTGGGRGIGREYSRLLAEEGARVVVVDSGVGVDGEGPRSKEPADDVAAEIVAAGGEAVASYADVSDFDEAGEAVQVATSTFGRLDIVVNNAGIIRPVYLYQAGPKDWYDVLAAHAGSTFNCIRHGSEAIIAGGEGGSIVNVGSKSADLYFPRIGAYRAAKAAIAITTVYVAEELKPFGINVNAIQPGGTATRMAEAFFNGLGDEREAFMQHLAETALAANVTSKPAADPATVPPLGVFLCTPAGRHITGRLFGLTLNSIGLVNEDAPETVADNGDERWTVESLQERIHEIFPQLAPG